MSYSRRIDRHNPALILFLVDQSDSMAEPLAGSTTSKAAAVAEQLNAIVYELILRCVKTPQEPPRDYFRIGGYGYSTSPSGEPLVRRLLNVESDRQGELVSTADLRRHPLRVDRRPTRDGGVVSMPVWMEPTAAGGTPMCAAMNRAGRQLATWCQAHPSSYPPIVLNLTDGEATDGDAHVWSRRLCSLGTEDGRLLLFNINLSSRASRPTLFPADPSDVDDEFGRSLFAMSSVLPESMLATARAQGLRVTSGSRGFATNADIKTMASFLNVGTSIGRGAR